MAKRLSGYLLEPLIFNPVEQDDCTSTVVLFCVLQIIKFLPLANVVSWSMYVVCEKIGQIGNVPAQNVRYVRRIRLIARIALRP